MSLVMLSTKDNPYNPITNFDEWFAYDMDMGYNSCGLLDRIAKTSDALTDSENFYEIERAIDEIIQFDPTNNFIKIVKETG